MERGCDKAENAISRPNVVFAYKASVECDDNEKPIVTYWNR